LRPLTSTEAEEPVTLGAPYRFLPTLAELDPHLIREGPHEELWRAPGARIRTARAIDGTALSVSAAHPRSAQAVGALTAREGPGSALRPLGASGVSESLRPGIGGGEVYKFRRLGAAGTWPDKPDPMARLAEVPPATGSVVTSSDYDWG